MRRTLPRRHFQIGSTLFWVLLWLAVMAAITFWCVKQHVPALQAKIQANAQTALASAGAQNIGLNVEGRTATLTGQAQSETQRDSIVESVASADGIRTVNNLMSVNGEAVESAESTLAPEKAEVPTSTAANADNAIVQENAIAENTTENSASEDKPIEQQQVEVETEAEAEQLEEPTPTSDTTDVSQAAENVASEALASPSAAIQPEQTEPSVTAVTETAEAESSPDAEQSVDEMALALVEQARLKREQSATTEKLDSEALVELEAEQPIEITEPVDVSEAVAATATGSLPSFNLNVTEGTLNLSGDMSNRDDMIEFIQSAMDALNASYVINGIELYEDRQNAFWIPELKRFIPSMANIDNAQIDIIETQVTLSGVAPSTEEHDQVINDALDILSDLSIVERISIKEADAVESTESVEPTETAELAVTTDDGATNQTLNDQRAFLKAETDALARERILFQSGSDVLTEDSLKSIEQIAELLSRYPEINVEINGHTDSSGNSSNNLQLSQLRANAVRDYLVEQGINVTRLSAYGFGDGVPIADNSTPAGRKLNRRIEFNF